MNWLADAGGVQLEQPYDARTERAGAIADAVADGLEDW